MVKGTKKGELVTHCKYGHEYTSENTMIRKRNRGRGIEIHRVCKECHKLNSKKYNDNLTVEQKLKRNLRVKEWRINNKDRVKNSKLYSVFKITLDDYNKILENQNNKCLICDKLFNEEGKYLCVDHCHNTGKIRGLLCSKCNGSLGWFEKYSDNILEYLSKNKENEIKIA